VDQGQKPRERSFISELVPEWRPTRAQVLWSIRIVLVLVVLLGILTLVGLPFGITLWDWLTLLFVPAVIAAGGVWFNQQQRERELDVADQRAQDDALQAYFDQIGELLLDKDQPLRQSQEGDEVQTLARGRTLTVLERLRDLQVVPGQVAQAHVSPKDNVIRGQVGTFRKRAVVQFLYEGGLIQKDQSLISLQGADLSGAYLSLTTLRAADLHQTILVGADLSAARLNDVDLRVANLLGADLRHAVLGGADLRNTALVGAYLLGASLNNADLRNANLTNADLRYADLEETNLSGADLSGADLRTELYRTDLSRAEGISNEELEQQAELLEGVTMPNGQKYEEWLKDKGREEDGNTGGPP
jgi:uncharacterized protein YjbI with pentapeptide repeats